MLLRKVAPQFATRIVKPVSNFALGLLLLSVLPVLVKVFPVAWSLIGDGTIIGIMAFIVLWVDRWPIFSAAESRRAGNATRS